ncbi:MULTISPECIES: chromate efflux transporter [Alphaproteobacteria]|uniref:Chromate transporter n=2 Tax=Alphaproteobacteria TaxID=28211 RepID=A0A512HI37_9HYPH|nr:MULTISPECIES: chromate efflux transporter [Alphaproteobacteria]GEO85114.1 chromate transporter [Ciceribacter naphthalenivorans]GLR24552.1 chromate transporter [Ciceribacter naphthalenivorans]GLT07408.1 chromate transporter [Sphingomonas psychrolutea]
MTTDEQETIQQPSFGELLSAFLRIGLLSFGGPAAQIALMHRICVDERRWVSEARFLHALNFCMLLPGPEAQQLATYIGWLTNGVRGGIAAGLLFVLPGLAVILGLSALYAHYHDLGWVAGLFFGVKAAILAIVVEAVVRIGRRALTTRFHRIVAFAAFVALFVFSLPFPLVVLFAGVAGLAEALAAAHHGQPAAIGLDEGADLGEVPRRPLVRSLVTLAFWLVVWQAPILGLWLLSGASGLAEIFSFFSRMALVTFGGAYAVLAYVAQVAVEQYHWLKPGEMLDGLALAETTPGPLVLVLSYVGFLAGFRDAGGMPPFLGGIFGGLLAAWATFVPSFVWIFAGAPYVERLRGNRMITAALSTITAAVVGVILNLAVWFALHVLFAKVDRWTIWPSPREGVDETAPFFSFSLPLPDPTALDPAALGLAVLSAVMIFVLKQGMGRTLIAAAGLGLLYRLLR